MTEFEVIEKDCSVSIFELKFGVQFLGGSIEHVGNQHQVVEITLVHHIIVFGGESHAFLLCVVYVKRLDEFGVGSIHSNFHLLFDQLRRFARLSSGKSSLFHLATKGCS